MNYRVAIYGVRRGGTAKRAGKTVRFLTPEEAKPIALEKIPGRRVVMKKDADGNDTTEPEVKDGEIVVETYAPDVDPKIFGLFVIETMTEFRPDEEDMAADDWVLEVPETVSQAIDRIFKEVPE